MSEILTQAEIDALIGALQSGEAHIQGPSADERIRQIRVYDFRRPSKFSKDQIRTLQMLHDNLARLLTTYFSTLFRTMVQLTVSSVDELTYGEFTRSLASPGIIGVVNLEPLAGSGILEIGPSIAFPMIDRLFGGAGQTVEKYRALSEIEQTVVQRVLMGFFANLREAWKNIIELRPRLETIETNPLFTQVVPANEIVVAIVFRAKIGDHTGTINFCIPFIAIEPVLPRLTAHNWFAAAQREQGPAGRAALRARVEETMLPVSLVLGEAGITVAELLDLKIGDVIRLNSRANDELTVSVGEAPSFLGRPGQVKNRLAVRITAPNKGGGENHG
ncbi:MAG: flagellar motor switch protein FliM [Bacillota bacterium]